MVTQSHKALAEEAADHYLDSIRVHNGHRERIKHIPVLFRREIGAVNATEAAKYLSIGRTTLWKLTNLGVIRRHENGTYPLRELDRYLMEGLV